MKGSDMVKVEMNDKERQVKLVLLIKDLQKLLDAEIDDGNDITGMALFDSMKGLYEVSAKLNCRIEAKKGPNHFDSSVTTRR